MSVTARSSSRVSAVAKELRRAHSPAEALGMRVAAVDKAVRLLGERLERSTATDLCGRAKEVAARTGHRLELSEKHTVVALAGSTGSGKSSLFNALTGLELSAVGFRRPTTGAPHACVWEPQGSGDLLDWLAVPEEHRTIRESELDADAEAPLRGLVLLDMPDHDSALTGHRQHVDRLVDLVDMLIWVVDPQKYADAAVHENYLRKLTRHHSVVVIVLNQADSLSDDDVDSCLSDLRRLVAAAGLDDTRVIATSAVRGDGLMELREFLADAVSSHRVFIDRLTADVDVLAEEFIAFVAEPARIDIDRGELTELHKTMASAAGVSAVTDAAEISYRQRARRYTDWPITRALACVAKMLKKPSALSMSTLDSNTTRGDGGATSCAPNPLAVDRAKARTTRSSVHAPHVEAAIRDLADGVAGRLPAPWSSTVRAAALAHLDALPAKLAEAVATTDTTATRQPRWWRIAYGAQWLTVAAALIGVVWLLGLVGANLTGHALVAPSLTGSLTLPLVSVLGGVALGQGLSVLGRRAIKRGQRGARAFAQTMLTDAVTAVARDNVLTPLRAELTAYNDAHDAIRRLAGHAGPDSVDLVGAVS